MSINIMGCIFKRDKDKPYEDGILVNESLILDMTGKPVTGFIWSYEQRSFQLCVNYDGMGNADVKNELVERSKRYVWKRDKSGNIVPVLKRTAKAAKPRARRPSGGRSKRR